MADKNKSSSVEQQHAGHVIFLEVEKALNIALAENPKVFLSDRVHIEPDFYSEEGGVVGEIFAHVGNFKVGQTHKIANDVLKMLLLDKVKGKTHRKIIIVCSNEEKESLTKGKSWLAEVIRQFDVEVMKIDISEDLKTQLIGAQKRQEMKNA